MRDTTRARVAAIVAAASQGRRVSQVYDHDLGAHRRASVEVSEGRVSGYDHGTASRFAGAQADSLDFRDFETAAGVQLRLRENRFRGFDPQSGRGFSGTVRGRGVTVHDDETGRLHRYTA